MLWPAMDNLTILGLVEVGELSKDFLETRKELLAAELNWQMEKLPYGDTRWLPEILQRRVLEPECSRD